MSNIRLGKIFYIKVFIMVIFSICIFRCDVQAAGTNLSTATPISLNSTISGKLTSDSQKDYYKFTISDNAIIKITAETEGHKEECCVYLQDADGNIITDNAGDYFFTTNDNDNWGYQSGSEICGLNKGTYYVFVRKHSGPDTTYTIKIKQVVKASSTVKVAGYENCYRNKAINFNVGNKLTSVTHLDTKSHYYKFKVEKKRTVFLKFNTPVSDENNYLRFDLYDSSGEQIVNYISVKDDSGKNNKTIKKVLAPGTYYIRAKSTDSYVRYTIKTQYKPYKTKITKLKSKDKSITVNWEEKSNITGYQIQYSRNSKFNDAKKITVSKDNLSKKIKGLKVGKKYYVRVRTYKKSFDVTYYSDWSEKKSITVKK